METLLLFFRDLSHDFLLLYGCSNVQILVWVLLLWLNSDIGKISLTRTVDIFIACNVSTTWYCKPCISMQDWTASLYGCLAYCGSFLCPQQCSYYPSSSGLTSPHPHHQNSYLLVQSPSIMMESNHCILVDGLTHFKSIRIRSLRHCTVLKYSALTWSTPLAYFACIDGAGLHYRASAAIAMLP